MLKRNQGIKELSKHKLKCAASIKMVEKVNKLYNVCQNDEGQ